MKLIIEIPDEVYNFTIQRGHLPYGVNIAGSIIDGEVTPKDRGDLNAITMIKKYVEIRQRVEEFRRKTTKEKPIETLIELQMYLKELEAHERCLANQVLDIFNEVN